MFLGRSLLASGRQQLPWNSSIKVNEVIRESEESFISVQFNVSHEASISVRSLQKSSRIS